MEEEETASFLRQTEEEIVSKDPFNMSDDEETIKEIETDSEDPFNIVEESIPVRYLRNRKILLKRAGVINK